tara:strand:+ start:849 stop:1232 length:384 start_codon:yes stop_codon:yes gene_type:complete
LAFLLALYCIKVLLSKLSSLALILTEASHSLGIKLLTYHFSQAVKFAQNLSVLIGQNRFSISHLNFPNASVSQIRASQKNCSALFIVPSHLPKSSLVNRFSISCLIESILSKTSIIFHLSVNAFQAV